MNSLFAAISDAERDAVRDLGTLEGEGRRANADGMAAWHPRSRQAYFYWRSVHPAAGLPGRQHIDPLDIPELLPGLWLVDVQRQPFRLRYRLVGTAVVEAYGREVTGLWLDEAHPQVGQDSAFFERYRSVVAQAAPNWRRGAPRFAQGHGYGEVENIILPLAADGTRVDMLMVHTVFFPPARRAGESPRAS